MNESVHLELKEHRCPVCGARFAITCNPAEYVYKIYTKRRSKPGSQNKYYTTIAYFCRYNCWRKAQADEKLRRIQSCPNCGEAFLPDNPNQKYCGEACRKAFTERAYIKKKRTEGDDLAHNRGTTYPTTGSAGGPPIPSGAGKGR